MAENEQKPVDPVGLVNQAILKERMENPYCPMALLMEVQLQKYYQGDSKALNSALAMAQETLVPRKPTVFEKIRNRIISRRS